MLVLGILIQSQRATFDVATVLVLAFAVAGVALVLWASRPSVIARYSADRKEGEPESPPPTSAKASPGGRAETR